MQTMHLFAGAGGGLLADLILGHRPIVAVEWDKYACKVLRERAADGWFPELSVFEGDVRVFDPSEYAGRVDCIHAGFPCQDISVAGKQAGVGSETRSGLYREVLRIADVVNEGRRKLGLEPVELFMENVSAILSNGLGTVLADLSARGYSARWICVRASDVGANHHRDRWWLLARRSELPPHAEHNGHGRRKQQPEGAESKTGDVRHPEYDGQPAESQLRSNEAASNERRQEESKPSEQPARTDRPADVSGVCGCQGGSERTGRKIPDEQHEDVGYTTSIGQSGQREYEQSISSKTDSNWEADRLVNNSERNINWWKSEPNVGRVVDGVASRVHRLKALGNGQVPLQAAVAFSILMDLTTKGEN